MVFLLHLGFWSEEDGHARIAHERGVSSGEKERKKRGFRLAIFEILLERGGGATNKGPSPNFNAKGGEIVRKGEGGGGRVETYL